MAIKKPLLIIITLSVLFVLSCNKTDYSPQSWEEYQTERRHMLLTTMLSSFSKNYPSHSLPMDTTHAYPFERNDGTRVLSIRLKASVEDYGVNAEALDMPDSIRERYMKNSVWLTVAEKNDTMSAVISVSIPTMEYMDRGAKKLPYVSIVHPQEFSGDMIILNVEGKYMGRYLFEHGIPDAEREPLTVKAWDKVSTKGGGEEEDFPRGWYEHWLRIYGDWYAGAFDNVNIYPPKDPNEDIYPPITPQEDPAAFCTMYPLMCEECERCGNMKIDCMCTPENEEDDDDESGGLPPTGGDNDGDDSDGGGNGNNGDGSSTSTPQYFPNTGNATLNPILVGIENKITNPHIQSLSQTGKIRIYAANHPSMTQQGVRAGTLPPDNGVYTVYISPDFLNEITEDNLAVVIIHELAHIVCYETLGINNNLTPEQVNELHHNHMIAPSNNVMENMMREFFPGREESFYEAMRYAGCAKSAAYNGLSSDIKDNVSTVMKENGFI